MDLKELWKLQLLKILRMNKKAVEMGKEPRHNLENAANKFSYIKADEKDRIVLILVDEELGF